MKRRLAIARCGRKSVYLERGMTRPFKAHTKYMLKIDAEVKEVEIWIALIFISYPHTSTTLSFLFLSRRLSSFLKRTPNPSRFFKLCNTSVTLLKSAPQPGA